MTSKLSPFPSNTPFLTAHWRHLVIVNYEVEPAILAPYVPRGTELDLFEGHSLASMVGFLFDQSRLFGWLPIPFHSSFEEVNLRFYVRRRVADQTQRGVVFIKELVPSRSVTWVARKVFGENYHRVPMQHQIRWSEPDAPELGGSFAYRWQTDPAWSELTATTQGELAALSPGSIEEFITEHYWGYARQVDGTTVEYAVEHSPWRVWQAQTCSLHADSEFLYGAALAKPLSAEPHSALVADGSPVAVFRGNRISG